MQKISKRGEPGAAGSKKEKEKNHVVARFVCCQNSKREEVGFANFTLSMKLGTGLARDFREVKRKKRHLPKKGKHTLVSLPTTGAMGSGLEGI